MMLEKVKQMFEQNKGAVIIPAAGIGAAVATVPTFAFAEGETVQSAVSGMATTIVTDGQAMLISIVPTVAPLVAAVIVATLGFKFVKRFTKSS